MIGAQARTQDVDQYRYLGHARQDDFRAVGDEVGATVDQLVDAFAAMVARAHASRTVDGVHQFVRLLLRSG